MPIAARTGVGLLSAFVVGLVGGWALAGLASDRRAEHGITVVRAPKSVSALPEPDDSAELAAPTRVPKTPEPADRTAPQAELPLVHDGLREYARDGIRRGWSSVRGDRIPDAPLAEGLDDYEDLVLESPERIGRRLGGRENENDAAREDAASGGVFALIATLNEGKAGPLSDLVGDATTFAAFFPRSAPETGRVGVNHLEHPDRAIDDGVTLEFPPGVFTLKRLMQEKDPFPRDVTIQGAGMDGTLLIFGDLSTRHRLRNFSVRDCTIFTANDYVFDLRVEPSSIRFDRVRVTGFDVGAGASCMLKSPGAAFYARNCQIMGGYGRSPRSGHLFRVDVPGLLARFESCRIETVHLGLRRLRAGATVVFANCMMSEILDWKEEADPERALFPGTVVDPYDWSQGEPRKKDLNDLFPDWEERINR